MKTNKSFFKSASVQGPEWQFRKRTTQKSMVVKLILSNRESWPEILKSFCLKAKFQMCWSNCWSMEDSQATGEASGPLRRKLSSSKHDICIVFIFWRPFCRSCIRIRIHIDRTVWNPWRRNLRVPGWIYPGWVCRSCPPLAGWCWSPSGGYQYLNRRRMICRGNSRKFIL